MMIGNLFKSYNNLLWTLRNELEDKIDQKLDQLENKISNSKLVSALSATIDKIDNSPLLNEIKNNSKIITKYNQLNSKIRYARSYDDSETTDLIKDTVRNMRPTALEMIKRKMKYTYKTLIYIITAITLFTMFGRDAYAFTAPPKPDNGWYVRDDSKKITASDMEALNSRIESFNKTTKNEIGVLIIPTLGDSNIENAANDVFNTWHIGKAGLDNGILIMIASNDRKIRIETGKGAEGDITDSQVPEITGSMKPFLRSNDYAGAVNTAIDSITKLMESRANQKAIVSTTNLVSSNNNSIVSPILLMGGAGLLVALLVWWFFREDKKYTGQTYQNKRNLPLTPRIPTPIPAKQYVAPPPMPRSPIRPTQSAAPIVGAAVAGAVIAGVSVAATKKYANKAQSSLKSTSKKSSSYSSTHSSDSYSPPSSSSSDSYTSPSSGSDFGGGSSGGGGGSDSW